VVVVGMEKEVGGLRDNKGGSRFICVMRMLKACRLCGVAPETQKSSYA
jgi:hypothetical protein